MKIDVESQWFGGENDLLQRLGFASSVMACNNADPESEDVCWSVCGFHFCQVKAYIISSGIKS